MEEKKIFDFTDDAFFDSTKKEIYDELLIKKDFTDYYVHEIDDGKVTVTINIGSKSYDCIFFAITSESIKEMIQGKKILNLRGCYINNFDIEKICHNKWAHLDAFDAQ